jgi:hypothetical protein
MRHVNLTNVNVVVNDRQDRTSVVNTCCNVSRRLRLCLREVRCAKPSKRIAQRGLGAMYVAPAGSPSWGGHRVTGGLGHPSRS